MADATKTSEWLEARARKPYAPNRNILLELAARFRAIEALEHHLQLDEDEHGRELDLGEAA
jgi:hypothetical protein